MAVVKGLQKSIWARSFLIAQGFNASPVTVYQDNQSTIKLIERRCPAAEQTRHVDIGYFWVNDLMQRGIINITYCPTLQIGSLLLH